MVKEKSTKEKIEDLKTLHKPTFDKLGIDNPLFIPRICYTPMGEKEQVVSFFEQDFVKGKDIYTHFVSKSYESEDPKNRLWKSYVERVTGPEVFDIDDEIPNPDQDLPIDQMSIRDLAAILLKKPVSKKQWLNDIIKS